ncbi:MAG: cyclohexanone monooxygenase [Rhodospirillaceae bacterium]|nr:cyclohexanone monooxygenase [Rhodospirillaceae bacterium]
MAKTSSVDAVIVGAGFSGLYLLYLLRWHGFSTRVFERGGDVGGTWFWNRYPGARCDVESMQYSYSFDEELQQEWTWPEKYSAQPDILRYIGHVADKHDLRKDITFETSVTSAHYLSDANRWTISTDAGETVLSQYFIMATGCISTANMPDIPGIDDFKGNTYHTGAWPHEKVDFAGQHVGVIGTGSSGIQSIPVIAEEAAHLTVFQRTPHWTVPARNVPMTEEYERIWKDNYAERRAQMRYSPSGSLRSVAPMDISALDVTDAEREEAYRERWAAGGMTLLKSYNDLLTSNDANETAAAWVRRRIAETVKDPAKADLLAPKTYPIGTKRLCLDTDYYETYNRENVDLIDIADTPIDRLTVTGLETGGRSFAFDSIVFATGFDAMTGTLLRVDIRGRAGQTLKKKWEAGPRTYLGLMCEGFPNMYTITGPGSPSVKSNMLSSIEQHVELVSDTLVHLRDNAIATMEPDRKAEDDWVDHVQDVANQTLFPKANSWYMGANIPGKPRLFMPYIGGVGTYRKICEDIVADNYRGFKLEGSKAGAAAAE